jgi:flagellar basal body-associated protein FliL
MEWLDSQVVASNKATSLLKTNNPAVVWIAQQVSVTVGAASTAGNVTIFLNGNMVTPTSALTPIVTSTGENAIGQTAAGDPYIYLHATDELSVVATSVTNGDRMTIRIQYRQVDANSNDVWGY